MKDFSEELKQVPQSPGVYLMRDADDRIIYVGKAINLRRRVRSYFTPSSHGKTAKVLAMVEHVDHFEYILVKNEVESLVLESNFIKQHRPKYNILLRDDKQYPYIAIPKEKFPRLLKVRQVHNDGGRYFGPYPNAYAVNDTIRLLQRMYLIRTCSLDFDKDPKRSRPCLNYDMGQCLAPCMGWADEAAYLDRVDRLAEILRGKDSDLRAILEKKMQEASDALAYEKAAGYRDDLRNLDALQEKQQVSFSSGKDVDVIAMARGSEQVSMQVFFVRGGKIVNRESYEMEEAFQEEAGEIIASFLKQFYVDATTIPQEILVEEMPEDRAAIEDFLSDKRGSRVHIHVPQRGDKHGLLLTARTNAEVQLEKARRRRARRERDKDRGIRALEELVGRDLDRLEAYDISNLSGVQNVGSMVVYRRERKESKEYRKFKIKTVEGIDEYASQREMLSRRFDHGLKDRAEGKTQTGFGVLPSLVLMDGGIGQVHVAEAVLRERGLDIPVLGLFKDDKHRTKGIFYQEKERVLDPRSPLYKFLYAIQEEVHRFAISYHRKLRSKDMLTSGLDQVEGVGPKRRQALLRAFGSMEALEKASLEEIRQVPGIPEKVAQHLIQYFAERRVQSAQTPAQSPQETKE